MPTPAPYDTDIALWAAEQARPSHEGRFGEGRLRAAAETGLDLTPVPTTTPFTAEQALDPDFLP